MINLDDLKREVIADLHDKKGEHDFEAIKATIDYLANRGYINQIPEGYALVPIEPTEEMYKSGEKVLSKAFSKGYEACPEITYKAMIAAAQSDEKGG